MLFRSDVVFSKARLVSEFRHKFNLFKSRLINDLAQAGQVAFGHQTVQGHGPEHAGGNDEEGAGQGGAGIGQEEGGKRDTVQLTKLRAPTRRMARGSVCRMCVLRERLGGPPGRPGTTGRPGNPQATPTRLEAWGNAPSRAP